MAITGMFRCFSNKAVKETVEHIENDGCQSKCNVFHEKIPLLRA